PSPEPAPAAPIDPLVRPCSGQVSLLALVAPPSRRPDLGFATILREGKTSEYRIGQDVGSQELVRLTWNRAYLEQPGGGECFLDIRHPDLSASTPPQPVAEFKPFEHAPPPAVSQAPESMSREDRFAGAVRSSIETVSETERNVQRSLVATILDNQDLAMRQARVMPHEDRGEVVGFKIYGIRRDSLFGTLGLENGDLIESVNGIPMTGADKALQAYGRLRMADRISIALTRRGQRVTLDYNIR
ncbi:MAG: type II secretion system protein GspC, partial [Myxococcota bacterium]|nr:type II secretion system protein GspC [Myxococcota bacterium]